MVTEQCPSVMHMLMVADHAGLTDVLEYGSIAMHMLIVANVASTAVITEEAVVAV